MSETNPGGSWSGTFTNPQIARVHYGRDSMQRLVDEVQLFNARRILVISSRTLASGNDLHGRVVELLGSGYAGSYLDAKAHVPRSSVFEALAVAWSLDVDMLVSLGGGSVIDLAKAVAICLAEGVTAPEQLDALRTRVLNGTTVQPALAETMLPHVALSTTLSGAEFTAIAGITDPVRREKDAYRAHGAAPRAVILDPELTRDTPGWLFAGTGMRAVDHCVETLYSPACHPVSDALCSAALGMLVGALPAAARDSSEMQARAACQIGTWMSITSLPSVTLGLSHAIGHQLGARCGMPHGITSAVMLPTVMEFNRPATASVQARMAQTMGVDTSGLTTDEAAAAAALQLRELVVEMGIDGRLSSWGVQREDLGDVADRTMSDPMVLGNPLPVRSPGTVLELLESVW